MELPPPSRPKILIIDDEPEFREVYRRVFEEAKFETRISSGGMDGIVQSVEFQPDIILLDLLMPDVDGFEVISALRNNSDLNVIIAVYSNQTDAEAIRKVRNLGAEEYIKKVECPPTKLVFRIREVLAARESRKEKGKEEFGDQGEV